MTAAAIWTLTFIFSAAHAQASKKPSTKGGLFAVLCSSLSNAEKDLAVGRIRPCFGGSFLLHVVTDGTKFAH